MLKLQEFSTLIHTGDMVHHVYHKEDDRILLERFNSHYHETVQLDLKGKLLIKSFIIKAETGERTPEVHIPVLNHDGTRLTTIDPNEAQWLSNLTGIPVETVDNPEEIVDNYNALPEIVSSAKTLADMFQKDGFRTVNLLAPCHGCQIEIQKKDVIVRIWIDHTPKGDLEYQVAYQENPYSRKHPCKKPEVLLKQANRIVEEVLSEKIWTPPVGAFGDPE